MQFIKTEAELGSVQLQALLGHMGHPVQLSRCGVSECQYARVLRAEALAALSRTVLSHSAPDDNRSGDETHLVVEHGTGPLVEPSQLGTGPHPSEPVDTAPTIVEGFDVIPTPSVRSAQLGGGPRSHPYSAPQQDGLPPKEVMPNEVGHQGGPQPVSESNNRIGRLDHLAWYRDLLRFWGGWNRQRDRRLLLWHLDRWNIDRFRNLDNALDLFLHSHNDHPPDDT